MNSHTNATTNGNSNLASDPVNHRWNHRSNCYITTQKNCKSTAKAVKRMITKIYVWILALKACNNSNSLTKEPTFTAPIKLASAIVIFLHLSKIWGSVVHRLKRCSTSSCNKVCATVANNNVEVICSDVGKIGSVVIQRNRSRKLSDCEAPRRTTCYAFQCSRFVEWTAKRGLIIKITAKKVNCMNRCTTLFQTVHL